MSDIILPPGDCYCLECDRPIRKSRFAFITAGKVFLHVCLNHPELMEESDDLDYISKHWGGFVVGRPGEIEEHE